MLILRAVLGLVFFCFVAWLMSSSRRKFPWRLVLSGVALQFVLAWCFLENSFGLALFQGASSFVAKLTSVAEPGAKLVFGPLADFGQMAEVFGPEGGYSKVRMNWRLSKVALSLIRERDRLLQSHCQD